LALPQNTGHGFIIFFFINLELSLFRIWNTRHIRMLSWQSPFKNNVSFTIFTQQTLKYTGTIHI
jgi:hypothetical protein